jgi:hypothetical protein
VVPRPVGDGATHSQGVVSDVLLLCETGGRGLGELSDLIGLSLCGAFYSFK